MRRWPPRLAAARKKLSEMKIEEKAMKTTICDKIRTFEAFKAQNHRVLAKRKRATSDAASPASLSTRRKTTP